MEIVCIIYCLLITFLYVFTSIQNHDERKRLHELLASKDYNEYKSFEKEEEQKEHVNMFSVRNKKVSRMYDEQE